MCTIKCSDYCACIPERRWWRLFSAAPIGMKCVALLCSIVCAFFLPCQVLWIVYKLFEERYCREGLHMMFGPGFHLALGCAGFFIAPVLVPMIWGAVRGWIPYVSFIILAVFWGAWYLVESAGPDTALWIFYLSCLAVLLLIPYFTPAAIRWRARCREERRAFSIAVRSGADLTSLEVREYPLKKVAIGIYLFLVLGVLGLSLLAELKVFCALGARGGAHPVADLGKDDGTLKEMCHSDFPGYISDDGMVLVCGPDWDREGGKCPPGFYPVWVARKKSGRFGGFEKMLCKMVDSGSSGNFTLETTDQCFRFENDAFCYSSEESGGVIPIYCGIKEDGEMVRRHLCLFSASWCPPCRAEMPRIAKAYAETLKDDPDIELIHFSCDRDDSKAMAWAKEHDVKFPVVKPKGGNPLDLHTRGIPHLFVVKDDGTLLEEGHPMGLFKEEKIRALKQ